MKIEQKHSCTEGGGDGPCPSLFVTFHKRFLKKIKFFSILSLPFEFSIGPPTEINYQLLSPLNNVGVIKAWRRSSPSSVMVVWRPKGVSLLRMCLFRDNSLWKLFSSHILQVTAFTLLQLCRSKFFFSINRFLQSTHSSSLNNYLWCKLLTISKLG